MDKLPYFSLLYNRGFIRHYIKDIFPVLPYICISGKKLNEIQQKQEVASNKYFLFQKDNSMDDEFLIPETFYTKTFRNSEKYIITSCSKEAKIYWENFNLDERKDLAMHTELERTLLHFGFPNGYIQKGRLAFLENLGIRYFLNICP